MLPCFLLVHLSPLSFILVLLSLGALLSFLLVLLSFLLWCFRLLLLLFRLVLSMGSLVSSCADQWYCFHFFLCYFNALLCSFVSSWSTINSSCAASCFYCFHFFLCYFHIFFCSFVSSWLTSVFLVLLSFLLALLSCPFCCFISTTNMPSAHRSFTILPASLQTTLEYSRRFQKIALRIRNGVGNRVYIVLVQIPLMSSIVIN